MSSTLKKLIYWGVYIFLMLCGIVCKTENLLPIKATTIFLFGLIWMWTGVSLSCKLNPYYAQKYARSSQIVFAVSSIGLGTAWLILSFTNLSTRAMPIVLVSIPFLVIDFIMSLRDKNL